MLTYDYEHEMVQQYNDHEEYFINLGIQTYG